MKHFQKAPRKPLFNEKQGEIFIECIDDVVHKKIAKLIFVEGMTNEEVAEQMNYCKRQIERIRIDLMKMVLKRLIEKQMPKKVGILTYRPLIDSGWEHSCPNCGCAVGENKNLKFAYTEYLEPLEDYCCCCGQALDWKD